MQRWRGPRWLRPVSIASGAAAGSWNHGHLSGWGLFEMADFCDALGAVCVIDVHIDSVKNSTKFPPEYFADLVEYMHGDSSTEWGRVRIADGHPKPYNVTHFELGNEQYNYDFAEQVAYACLCVCVCTWMTYFVHVCECEGFFVRRKSNYGPFMCEQVAAMEARATKVGCLIVLINKLKDASPMASYPSRYIQVGMKGQLTYLWPTAGDGPDSADAPAIAALDMTSQLAVDLHAGGGFPGLPDARNVFVAPRTKGWGAMVSECRYEFVCFAT